MTASGINNLYAQYVHGLHLYHSSKSCDIYDSVAKGFGYFFMGETSPSSFSVLSSPGQQSFNRRELDLRQAYYNSATLASSFEIIATSEFKGAFDSVSKIMFGLSPAT